MLLKLLQYAQLIGENFKSSLIIKLWVPIFWGPHLEKWNFSVPYCNTKMNFYKVLTYQEGKINHCLIFRDTF